MTEVLRSYILQRGASGARRLRLLMRAAAPATRRLLDAIGIQPGWDVLDAGCGIGGATALIARRGARCLGVDADAGFVEAATARGIAGAEFRRLELERLDSLGRQFDLVYARYLLSHLADAAAGLRALAARARPGAIVAVEDVDFEYHVHHPPCAAVARYVELYQAAARARGANPCLGRELLRLFLDAGLTDVHVQLSMTMHNRGPCKALAEITLANVEPALVGAGLSTPEEIVRVVAELRAWRQDPSTLLSLAPTFQVWGRMS